ncbi:MAG TPA: hypothetical protein VHV57_06540 [Acidimicrobiales bacterium]|nr:hypothetical protein [Acidimicrobiales bacterium]
MRNELETSSDKGGGAVPGPAPVEEEHGVTFWIAAAIGWTAIAIGVFGIVDHPMAVHAFKLFRLLIGLNIFNDAIVVPIVLAVAVLVRRRSPRWLMAPAQVWLIISAVVCLYAYPFVGDYGRTPSNPSLLPFNYAHRALLLLGIITAACGVYAVVAWRRSRVSEV